MKRVSPHRSAARVLHASAALLAAGVASFAGAQWVAETSPARPPESAEFHFVRLAYSDAGGGVRRRAAWLTDWPQAEQHLLEGLRRMTRLDIAPQGSRIAILDEDLFDHPWLYAVEVGHWELDPAEVERLREYLLRGGFLMVDDFHGTREWEVFTRSMQRVFPDRPIVDLPEDAPLFHVVYDLGEDVQIPGIHSVYSAATSERDGVIPRWRGIYDDEGRLMVLICFNMDQGDAWEHADTPEYPLRYTALAYRYAVNYIVYAMTH